MPPGAATRVVRFGALFLLATAAGASEIPWPEIDALAAAGHLEAALERLPAGPPAAAPREELLRLERTRHDLLNRLGRYAEAQEAGRRWIALAEAAGDADQAIAAHQATGRSYSAHDRHEEGEAHFRRALDRLGPGDDSPRAGWLRLDLADAAINNGDYVGAESLLRRVEASLDTGRNPALLRQLWRIRGSLLSFQGDPLSALDYRERALGLAEESGDPHKLATELFNLAQSSIQVHDYARALALLQRALALDPPSRIEILARTSQGICRLELNQLDEAEVALEHARRLAIEAANPSLESWAIGELGLVAWKRRDGETALARFERAIELCRRTGDPRNEAIWWQNTGMVHRDQRRFEEALAAYRSAERVAAGIPGARPHPNLRKHIGQALAGLGRLEDAEAFFREALALAAAAADTKVQWETQRELARLRRRQGRPAEAAAAYEAALAGIETIRGSLRLPAFKTDFFANKVEVYAEAAEFLLAAGGADGPARAFEVAERARARAFLDDLVEARAAPHEALPPEILEEERRLLGEISALQGRIRRDGSTAALAEELARREAELEALAVRAGVESPRFGRLRYPRPASLPEVQAALPPGAVVVAYFLAEPVSHRWTVRRDGLDYRALPGEGDVASAVRTAYAGLLDPAVEPRLGELGATLLAGLPLDPPPELLWIVPSGILHALPFEALPAGDRLLAELAPTAYLPSASALVELGAPPARAEARLLALGDPIYDSAPDAERSAALAGLRRLGALPHSRTEVRGVAAEFGRGAATLLLGAEATESRLKAEELPAYGFLHLAAHGWIDPASPARSGLVLGGEDGEGGEDGLLQFREILRLRLAARLVTLSACRTAIGETVTGEGMVGLARAFFHAGASSVAASLWNVEDEASAELMLRFYAGLRAGRSQAAALREARLALRRDERHRHPYYWAPFVLLGRADQTVELPPRRFPAAAWWAAAGCAAALALLLAWSRRRRRPPPAPRDPAPASGLTAR